MSSGGDAVKSEVELGVSVESLDVVIASMGAVNESVLVLVVLLLLLCWSALVIVSESLEMATLCETVSGATFRPCRSAVSRAFPPSGGILTSLQAVRSH